MINKILSFCALIIIRNYQRFLSPHLGSNCRFVPACSEYASQAIKHRGFFKGSAKAFTRLLRCHPFHAGGDGTIPVSNDPVRDKLARI